MNTVLAGTPEEHAARQAYHQGRHRRGRARADDERAAADVRGSAHPDLGGADALGDPDRDPHLLDGNHVGDPSRLHERVGLARPAPRERGRQQSGGQPGRDSGRVWRITAARSVARRGVTAAAYLVACLS